MSFMPESDDLDALINSPIKPASPARPIPATPDYSQPCAKCRGTGRFVSWSGRMAGQCFACKGQGKKTFKTSPQARAASATRKTDNAAANWESFKSANADIANWIESSGDFAFAVSMRDAVQKYGDLTPGQLAACQRCVDGRKRAADNRQARADNAPSISIAKIETALNTAKANGLKRPRLLLDTFKFSLAPATGQNAGAIYVKESGEYLGKILSGKLHTIRACGVERECRILKAAAEPEAAAVAYGKLTGSCSCCGRELSNSESIARGIGPICAVKFGW